MKTLPGKLRGISIGIIAALGTVTLLTVVATYFVPMLRGQTPYTDYSIYYEAMQRFLADPNTLYADPKATPETGGAFNYPPPTAMLLYPFALLPPTVSYFTFTLLGYAASAAAMLLFAAHLAQTENRPLLRAEKLTALLLGLLAAPVLQNLKHGQINSIVLLCAVMFLITLSRGRYMLAGLMLSAGFLLKLYPILLLPLAAPFIFRRGFAWSGRVALRLAGGFVALPLLSLAILPFGLYAVYFGDFLPRLSGITCLSGLNQSLPGVIGRLAGEGTLTSWSFVPINVWVRVLTGVIVAASAVWALYMVYRFGRENILKTGSILLAVTPLVSPLGWEYSFVLAMPLIGWLVLSSGQLSKFRILPWLLLAAMFLLSIPKPNDGMVSRMEAFLPQIMMHVFFARWTLATVVLMAIGVRLIHQSRVRETD